MGLGRALAGGVWETEVPQRGPGAEPQWGYEGETRRMLRHEVEKKPLVERKNKSIQANIV